ncbi:MAG: amidohydrolase family protein [Verrucomicrobiota bacterium]
MVIDCHAHAFPEEAVANPQKWALEKGEKHWSELVLPSGSKPSLQCWRGKTDFYRETEKDGIEYTILLGWYWENPDTCSLHNDEMAGWLRQFPSKFSALASVHPGGPPPGEVVAKAVEQGFSGFGEIHPTVQHSSILDPFWQELAERSAQQNLAFNFHVSELVGRTHGGRLETPFQEIQRFISDHPELTVILSHWGGGLLFYELNPFVRKEFANVFYDSAASPLLYDPKIFELACQMVGAEKILFGSDYPLRLYPASEKGPGRARFLSEISQSGLSGKQLDAILHRNASRLFDITEV